MTQPITVLATSKLAPGVTEADFIAASDQFQRDFVDHQPGVLRRDLLRKDRGLYVEVIHFRGAEDLEDVQEKEKTSAACHAYLSTLVMDGSDGTGLETFTSLATYLPKG